MGSNIVLCPNCKARLIEEELPLHKCKTNRLQWFFEGNYFWGNQGDGWFRFPFRVSDEKKQEEISKPSDEDETEPPERLLE